MARYKIVLEYHGLPYVGWQRQKNGVSVQQVIEEAIAKFTGEKAITYVAGRTDAGVHATGQVCHFDSQTRNPLLSEKRIFQTVSVER